MTLKPLRILHLTAGSDAGGISCYLRDLAVAMGKLGHEVAVAGQRGVWHDHFDEVGVRWVDARLKAGPLGLWAESRRLGDYVHEHPVDVLHVHYRKAALVGRLLQRRLQPRPPLLYTLHLTDMPMGFPRRMLSDFGDHAHAPSEQARRWLTTVGRMPEQRVTLIPHGIDPDRFPLRDDAAGFAARARLGLSADDRVLVCVGRLEDPKNEMWCIDLVDEIRNSKSEIRTGAAGTRSRKSDIGNLVLLFAGDGPNRPVLERRIAQSGLRDCVRLLGDCDPLPVYEAADLLLLPSAREGFSYACAEAMSCGVAVLRTRTAGTEEMTIENVTGRSCEIDHDAFMAAATEMLSLPCSRLREMGQAGAAHIRQNLRFDQQVARTVELYRRLIGRAEG